jgi:hypothetical protein
MKGNTNLLPSSQQATPSSEATFSDDIHFTINSPEYTLIQTDSQADITQAKSTIDPDMVTSEQPTNNQGLDTSDEDEDEAELTRRVMKLKNSNAPIEQNPKNLTVPLSIVSTNNGQITGSSNQEPDKQSKPSQWQLT